MNDTFSKLKEIDSETKAIRDHILAEKNKLTEEYAMKTRAFDEEVKNKTAQALSALQSSNDKKIDEELETLDADTKASVEALNSYYENNKKQLAGDIFKQVTGTSWEA